MRQQNVAAKDTRDLERDRRLLLESFPGVPSIDADQIMKHGFEKGSGRVGRTTIIDEDTKFELAVTAHIRHKFTDYDSYWKQMKAGTQPILSKERARSRVHYQVQSIAASWSLEDIADSVQTSTHLRRSTRQAKKKIDPDKTGHKKERQNHMDSNTSKVRKSRASKAKRFNEATLSAVFESLNLDSVAEDPAVITKLISNARVEGPDIVSTTCSRRVANLAVSAKRSANPRKKLRQDKGPDASRMNRDREIKELERQVGRGDKSAPSNGRDCLLTNRFQKNDDVSTFNVAVQNDKNPAHGLTEAALSSFGRSQARKDQMLNDLNDLKQNPHLDLIDKRFLMAFKLNIKLGGNQKSLGSLAEARYLAAQDKRLIKRRARKAARKTRQRGSYESKPANGVLVNSTGSRDGTKMMWRGSQRKNKNIISMIRGKQDLAEELEGFLAEAGPLDEDSDWMDTQ